MKENKQNLNVWLMMGLPGSGKSTYIEQHLEDVVIVSQDEIRKIFYGNQFYPNAEFYVHGDAKNISRLMLSQGKSIVIDATSILNKYRKEWKSIAKEYGANYTIIFIDTPKEICLKRNKKRPKSKQVPDSVIENMDFQMQRPLKLESANGNQQWWDHGEEVNVIHIEK